jgi:hypothetical protein
MVVECAGLSWRGSSAFTRVELIAADKMSTDVKIENNDSGAKR